MNLNLPAKEEIFQVFINKNEEFYGHPMDKSISCEVIFSGAYRTAGF